jgi:hypothetical protein
MALLRNQKNTQNQGLQPEERRRTRTPAYRLETHWFCPSLRKLNHLQMNLEHSKAA